MADDTTSLLGEHGHEAIIPLRGRVFVAPVGAQPPHGGSVEHDDEGWPIPGTEQPAPPVEWVDVGEADRGVRIGGLVLPEAPAFDFEALRRSMEALGRGLTVQFQLAGQAFERAQAAFRLLWGPDAPRSPYVRRLRTDYRRRSKARARRGRR